MRVRKPDTRKRARGRCPECGFTWKLRVDGTLEHHQLVAAGRRVYCEGGGETPNESA